MEGFFAHSYLYRHPHATASGQWLFRFLRGQSISGGQLRAEAEVCGHHWVPFPYDLAEFVSPWQGFRGGDSFFTGKRGVADRKVTEIAGIRARGQALFGAGL